MKRYFFSILVLIVFFSACSNSTKEKSADLNNEEVEAKSAEILYGFSTDTLLVTRAEIGHNEFLSNILSRHNVNYGLIDKISKESRDIFDVRKLQSGKSYCILSSKDSTAKCFIYEPNEVEYVVYDFSNSDSLVIYKHQKPVEVRERAISGVINSSLYTAMQRNGGDPTLAISLSEIYAWTIDFYRIQPGDKFKVIINEQFVEGKPIGFGKIKAAYFQHKGEDFYAFPFEQNGVKSYYDEKSKSLKKAFLQAPLKFSRISSRYSARRLHPVLKTNRPHLGTDYAAPSGTPIMTTGDGVVIAAGYTRGNGKYVKVKHNDTYTTQYLHMSKFAAGIKKGRRVRQGEVIGYVGSTGLATGPHVCYRFWKHGKQVDPFKEKTPPAEPISKDNVSKFNEYKEEFMKKLQDTPYNEQDAEELLTKK